MIPDNSVTSKPKPSAHHNDQTGLSICFRQGEQAMLPGIGVLLLSDFGRSDRSTEMTLCSHRRSLAGNCEIGHKLTPSPADYSRDVGR